MPTHLLDLPPELMEHILALLSHQDAPSLAACRQTCSALHKLIADSQLVRYIERTALLGVYDPYAPPENGTASTQAAGAATTTTSTNLEVSIPERALALEAWNGAWCALDKVLFTHEPVMRFAMPTRAELRAGRTAQVEMSPSSGRATATTAAKGPSSAEQEQELGWGREEEDEDGEPHCHFSFGPWFVAAAREGPGVRAGYSYLDVHGSLGGGGRSADAGWENQNQSECGGGGGGEGGPPRWTTINVPVRDVVVFALSTELDLAVAISCVFLA
jgi:hypothetical protein